MYLVYFEFCFVKQAQHVYVERVLYRLEARNTPQLGRRQMCTYPRTGVVSVR
jgi:hypothetical protein